MQSKLMLSNREPVVTNVLNAAYALLDTLGSVVTKSTDFSIQLFSPNNPLFEPLIQFYGNLRRLGSIQNSDLLILQSRCLVTSEGSFLISVWKKNIPMDLFISWDHRWIIHLTFMSKTLNLESLCLDLELECLARHEDRIAELRFFVSSFMEDGHIDTNLLEALGPEPLSPFEMEYLHNFCDGDIPTSHSFCLTFNRTFFVFELNSTWACSNSYPKTKSIIFSYIS